MPEQKMTEEEIKKTLEECETLFKDFKPVLYQAMIDGKLTLDEYFDLLRNITGIKMRFLIPIGLTTIHDIDKIMYLEMIMILKMHDAKHGVDIFGEGDLYDRVYNLFIESGGVISPEE